jgi:uncharacterized protein
MIDIPLRSTRLILSMATLVCITSLGCASHFERTQAARDLFYSGQLTEANKLLEKRRDWRFRNHDVKQLDRSMVLLAQGQPREAERVLRTVRDKFDQLEETSYAEQGLSLLTDDNTQAYAGEDYERVLIRGFLALSNLMGDGHDAGAYALQMTDKQQQVIARAEKRFGAKPEAKEAYQQVALGPYMRAMLDERSPLTWPDAERSRLEVALWAPNFRDAQADVERVKFESPTKPGMGTVYIFALVGRGPVKEQTAEIATQASLFIADRIVNANSDRGLPPTLAPVLVPKLVRQPSRVHGVRVAIDGTPSGMTATVVDIGEMAERQFKQEYPYIIARAVARRVLKKGVIYGAKEVVGSEKGSLPGLALDIAGVAWEATEVADTRCWSLLPDKIQVLRLDVPAGERTLTLQAERSTANLGRPARVTIDVEEARQTYVLANLADGDVIGQVNVNTP